MHALPSPSYLSSLALLIPILLFRSYVGTPTIFMVYFMTLLVSQIRYRRKVDLMNNELEKFGRMLSRSIRGTVPTLAWRYEENNGSSQSG
jgi:Flp pilus assembly protein TadB